MTNTRYMKLALLVTLGAGCRAEDDRPAPGSELGPCQDGFCIAPLVCVPEDICVDPAQLGGETDAGDDAEPMGRSTSPTPGGGSTGDGGETNADGGTDDGGADGGAADGGAADGGDGDGDADGDADADAAPPACVQFGTTYCSCLGDAAAPTCVSGSIESCADIYDLCPSYWTCVNASLAECNLDDSECSCG